MGAGSSTLRNMSQLCVIQDIADCAESGDYSDLVITCGKADYKVHKVIVCSRVEFFARAVEFGGKETTEGKIYLTDDEPAIVALLISYLYTGDYEPHLPHSSAYDPDRPLCVNKTTKLHSSGHAHTYEFPHTCRPRPGMICRYTGRNYVCPHHDCGKDCGEACKDFVCEKCAEPEMKGSSDQILLHAKLYEIADKYGVSGLKAIVEDKFKLASSTFWDDAAFPLAAHHAFSSTPASDKGLRDIVSGTISINLELLQKPEIEALMEEFNGLSLGILKKGFEQRGWGKKD